MIMINTDMPKSCKECGIAKNYGEFVLSKAYDCRCGITNTKVLSQPQGTKPDWCPLIEVVHCKDCKHYVNDHICQHLSRFGTIETDPDDFCSNGRRTE